MFSSLRRLADRLRGSAALRSPTDESAPCEPFDRAQAADRRGDLESAYHLYKAACPELRRLKRYRDLGTACLRVAKISLAIAPQDVDDVWARIGNYADEAYWAFRRAGCQGGIARALTLQATVESGPKAHGLCREAIEVAEGAGDDSALASALSCLAGKLHWEGQVAEALELYERAAALYRKAGDRASLGATLLGLAIFSEGATSRARALEAAEQFREAGHRTAEANAYYHVALNFDEHRDYASKEEYLTKAIALAKEGGDDGSTVACWLEVLEETIRAQGDDARADVVRREREAIPIDEETVREQEAFAALFAALERGELTRADCQEKLREQFFG